MSYNVYKVESLGNGDRNHQAIYIETDPSAPPESTRGHLYHVTGTILNGMEYDPRPTVDPEFLPEHIPGSKKQTATIAREDLVRFENECCLAVPAPRAQVTLSGKRLYPGMPLYRCGDWLQDVERVAFEKGIFKR